MIQTFGISTCQRTGMPYVCVPGDAIWSLLEFLSWQRVRTSYDYENGHCIVYFLHSDHQTAQQLIDDWKKQFSPLQSPPQPQQRGWLLVQSR